MVGLFGESAGLTLSTQAGRVSPDPPTTDAYRNARAPRLILIHGFNTSEEDALRVMRPFQKLLEEAFGPGAPSVLTSTWAGKSPLLQLGYPFRISFACASAQALLVEIQRRYRSAPQEDLILVAHSLGCRLVLEFLALLSQVGKPGGLGRLTIVLMAPAVPVHRVEPGGSLEPGLAAADRLHILHSHSDEALGWVFRSGQTAAMDGWFPHAVGLAGDPFSRDVRDDLSPLGHNGYWHSRAAALAVGRAIKTRITALALAQQMNTKPPLPLGPSNVAPPLPMA